MCAHPRPAPKLQWATHRILLLRCIPTADLGLAGSSPPHHSRTVNWSVLQTHAPKAHTHVALAHTRKLLRPPHPCHATCTHTAGIDTFKGAAYAIRLNAGTWDSYARGHTVSSDLAETKHQRGAVARHLTHVVSQHAHTRTHTHNIEGSCLSVLAFSATHKRTPPPKKRKRI